MKRDFKRNAMRMIAALTLMAMITVAMPFQNSYMVYAFEDGLSEDEVFETELLSESDEEDLMSSDALDSDDPDINADMMDDDESGIEEVFDDDSYESMEIEDDEITQVDSESGSLASVDNAFFRSEKVDGVIVSVSAPAGVFPQDASLYVAEVSMDERETVDKSVEQIRDENAVVAAAYVFDIKVFDGDGNELQPEEGQGVTISFESQEVADENLDVNVYRVPDEGLAEELSVVVEDEKATSETDGLSCYSVEFTYNKLQYNLDVEISTPLNDILDYLGLVGVATDAECSDSQLLSVKPEKDDWVITAHCAFTDPEWIKVTINGVVYEINIKAYEMDSNVELLASTMSMSEYESKMNAFINDSRWRHGTYYTNCYTYGCDFTSYMYGVSNYTYGSCHKSASNIQTGDVVRQNGHTFVVLKREGNDLYTAEGNYNGYVRVQRRGYYISGGTLYTSWNTSCTIEGIYHFVDISSDQEPIGYVDVMTAESGYVHIVGWACDRDNTSRTLGIHVYVDDKCIGTCEANREREDVDRAYGVGRYHGFDCSFETDLTGSHLIRVFALGVDGNGNNNGINVVVGNGLNTISFNGNEGTEMTTGAGRTIPDGDYEIVSLLDERFIVDIDGNEVPAKNCDNVHLYIRSVPQRVQDVFTVTYLNNGFYKIEQKGTSTSLDVANASTRICANVMAHASHGGINQQWSIMEDSFNGGRTTAYRIQSRISGFMLDVSGGIADNGRNIQVFARSDNARQGWLFVPHDTQGDDNAPIISNVIVSDLSSTGYTITCDVSDESEISKVVFSSWTTKDGQDDVIKTECRVSEGKAVCRVTTIDHAHQANCGYITHIYAYDKMGNVAKKEVPEVNVPSPITNVRVTNLNGSGYTVTCDVDMAWGVDHIDFPTWTTDNGQDDLIWHKGVWSGNTASYTVKTREHNNETNTEYITHIWVWDGQDNGTSVSAGAIFVTSDLGRAEITGIDTEYAYTGNEIRPVPTVSMNGVLLSNATDYDVLYENNINSGTARMTVRGKGSYIGSISILFNILSGYTINYELNGGVNNAENRSVYAEGKKVTLKAPTRDNYTFMGWYSDANFKKKVTTVSGGNKTVYAKWAANKYSIAFKGNGSTSGKMSKLANITYDEDRTLPANKFKKKGYDFIGWNTESDGSGDFYNDKAIVNGLSADNKANLTLYAQWRIVNYTITYNLNSEDAVNAAVNPGRYSVLDKIVLDKPTRQHYVFVGWYKNQKLTSKITTIAKGSTGDKILYAKWKPIKYTIVFNGNGATSGSMKKMTGIEWGKSKMLTANKFKKKGYDFVGWSLEPNGRVAFTNKASIKNLAFENGEQITLYAKWEPKE